MQVIVGMSNRFKVLNRDIVGLFQLSIISSLDDIEVEKMGEIDFEMRIVLSFEK